MLEMRRAGATTFGQDEKTSLVYGMPRVAFERGGVVQQLPLQKIGDAILRSCRAPAAASA
jgi:two-component system chemotaxis response regulator CheB